MRKKDKALSFSRSLRAEWRFADIDKHTVSWGVDAVAGRARRCDARS